MHQVRASGRFYEGDIVNYLKLVVSTLSAKCLLNSV